MGRGPQQTNRERALAAIRALASTVGLGELEALVLRALDDVGSVAGRAPVFLPVDLPLAVAEELGLSEAVAVAAAAAATSLWAGADLLDDQADGELGADWRGCPAPLVVLAAQNLLYCLPVLLLDSTAGITAASRAQACAAIARALASMSAGQAADLLGRRGNEHDEETVDLKTGREVGLFAALPALLAERPPAEVEGWRAFGQQLGCMAQVFSDSHEVFAAQPPRDLLAGRDSFALTAARDLLQGEDRAALDRLLPLAAAGDDEGLRDLRQLLSDGGIVLASLMRVEALRFRAAQALPPSLSALAADSGLRALLGGWSVVPVSLLPQLGGVPDAHSSPTR